MHKSRIWERNKLIVAIKYYESVPKAAATTQLLALYGVFHEQGYAKFRRDFTRRY
jgi:hypothetical protein